MKRLFGIIAALLMPISMYGQVTEFSSDPEKFLDQLSKHLRSFDQKDGKAFVEEFTPIWNGMGAADQSKVVSTCNLIQKNKLRIYPEFKGYILSVHNIFKKNIGGNVFHSWNDVMTKVLSQRQKKRMSDMLKSSANFFSKGHFFATERLAWNARSGKYEFGYDNAPFIKFDNITLTCYLHNDSSTIYNTSGIYRPYGQEFKGEGGKMLWTRVGLPNDETYAEFQTPYKINCKTGAYKLDSVTMHTTYFEKPLKGKITEKIIKNHKRKTKKELEKMDTDEVEEYWHQIHLSTSYPIFESYEKRFLIKEVLPEVDYNGGFILEGATFKGGGSNEEPARLTFYRKGKPFVTSEALVYNITDNDLSSPSAAIRLQMDADSITHPGLSLQYGLDKKRQAYKMTLLRPKTGVGLSPFSNSYHMLDMHFQALYWVKGDSVIQMGPEFRSSETQATFESKNYFNMRRYDEIGAMTRLHPMIAIADHSIRYDQFDWKTADLATAMGMDVNNQFPRLLYQLNNGGFVTYDKPKEMIHINQKLFDYVDNRAGKKDFDNIILESDPMGKANATLNILSYELTVRGLKRVPLSDRQFVKIYPKITTTVKDPFSEDSVGTGEVKIYKDRNIVFDGILLAGSTEYFGTHFNFDYQNFKVLLPQIDSMRLRVRPFGGGPGQRRLISVIEDIKGEIDIDGPSNKAGLDTSFHDYPKLLCNKESYVFYDKFFGGAYPRSTFRFKLAPFTMDSLDNFRRHAVAFDGILESAGIFPDFEEQLVVMPDYSLGFQRKAPKDGFDLYKDKGIFENTITLSGGGLQGDGVIEYVTSTSVSKAFTFFPDSTVGVVDSFVCVPQEKPIEFPDVKGYKVKIAYKPSSNVLEAKSRDKNLLSFFGNESTLKGKLFLTPKGMGGRGKMVFGNADLRARKFTYTRWKIKSDTSNFDLHSLDDDEQDAMAFKTHNVSADVDFKGRSGLFKSNDEQNYVEFPENQYICYMDEFKWYMDDDDIEMRKKQNVKNVLIESAEFDKPNFYSVHPDQDSLQFMAPKARYDIKAKTITCTEVPFMDIADARIIPDSGTVIVKKKAKIETLENAEIYADNTSLTHHILNATVDVKARRDYKAKGDYYYVDEDSNKFKIHFAKIEPDTSFTTYADGEIKLKEGFKLSQQFEFAGKVELYAINKNLVFDGATRIAHECDQIERNWMNFRTQIDPLAIYIPVGEDMEDKDKNAIGAGVIMSTSRDSLGIYSTFLSSKGKEDHPDVLSASGYLFYDKASKEYRISSKEKLQERTLPGNYVSLTKDCIIEGDGLISFASGLGQVQTALIGTVSHNMNNGAFSMRGAMQINFPFVGNALEKITDKINKTENLIAVEIGKTFYKKALLETMDKDRAEKIDASLALEGKIKGKFPDELLKTLYIADIRFKWNEDESAFVSEGLIGLAHMDKDLLFKYVNGRIVIQKNPKDSKGNSKDRMYVYLEIDEKTWYYFEYTMGKEGKMRITSTDEDFNNVLAETKTDKTVYKGEKGVADFEFGYFAQKSMRNGINRFVEEE